MDPADSPPRPFNPAADPARPALGPTWTPGPGGSPSRPLRLPRRVHLGSREAQRKAPSVRGGFGSQAVVVQDPFDLFEGGLSVH